MRNKASTGLFTGAYGLARSARLLEMSWFRRIFLSSYFLYKRWYEDPFWYLTERHPELFQGGHVLDIGANIGYTASLFARAVKQPAKVFAFEPDRVSFELLGEVIRRARLSQTIETINMAVGTEEGTVDFWHNDAHSADHRVVTERFRNSNLDEAKITTVAVTSVDNFVKSRNLERISFIKIDVQGYELAVCQGMKQTLGRFPDLCVCCEYSPESLEELGFQPSELLAFFRTAGYQIHALTRSALELAPHDYPVQRLAQQAGYVDLLCSKKVLA